jgi:hypothetical protein
LNFVGHAHVAIARHDVSPALVLGAMLPDFASMGGARLLPLDHPVLAAGVALHHRTDDLFHAAPEFVRLCSTWGPALEARGLSWGASRAVAHVGTELLLDGLLLDDDATRAAYLEAVAALEEPLVSAIPVRGPGAARWPALLARVRVHGAPDFYRDPVSVADRLIRILASRPRLTIDEAHRATLCDAMRALRRDVEPVASALALAGRAAVSA